MSTHAATRFLIRRSRRYVQLRSLTSSSSSSEDIDSQEKNNQSKEWIPPSRPLSGDKGQSHLYEGGVKSKSKLSSSSAVTTQKNGKNTDLEIPNDDDDGEYIDLDDLDLDELQEMLKNGDFDDTDEDNGMYELKLDGDGDEDMTIDSLIKEIEAMETSMHDPDDHGGEGDHPGDNGKNVDIEHGHEEEKEKQLFEQDKFQKHFETSDFLGVSAESPHPTNNNKNNNMKTDKDKPDWLATRRERLSRGSMTMLTPSESRIQNQQLLKESEIIQVKKHTLLTSNEIMSCLTHLGGHGVKLITPPENRVQFLGGARGLVVVTATNYSQVRILAETIVYHLRKRDLASCGVIGAKSGAVGGEDPTTSAYTRRKRSMSVGRKMDDGWMVVDCRNYIVHVLDEITRKSLDLEGLWGSKNSSQAKVLRNLDLTDDDAIDDYVFNNPIPEEYIESLVVSNDFWGGDGKYRIGEGRKNNKERNGRWSPSNNEKAKVKNRGRNK